MSKKILFLALFSLLLTSCQAKPALVSKQQFVLDTLVTIKVYPNKSNLKKSLSLAFKAIKQVEDKFNVYEKKSETALINNKAGEVIKVSHSMADLIKLSQEINKLTNGSFDPTVRPVFTLYHFDKQGQIPTSKALEQALKLVGFNWIKFNYQKRLLKLKAGMALDFGGIMKGKALDEASQMLKKQGVNSGLITTVSSISVLGPKPDGSAWAIGIQAPGKKEALAGVLKLKKGNISTSGSYQQFFIKKGQLYHHLINPKTGKPARGLKSVTVVTNKSNAFADALSTGLFIMGKEKGLRLVKKLKGVEAIFIDEKDKITVTAGLKNAFQPL